MKTKTKTFLQWVQTQRDREDRMGDLARDVADDRGYPTGRRGRQAWHTHLAVRCACPEALEALDEAWNEYESPRTESDWKGE